MRKVSVKSYKRRTKSGKVVTVKQHVAGKKEGKPGAAPVKGIRGKAEAPEYDKKLFENWFENAEKGLGHNR